MYGLLNKAKWLLSGNFIFAFSQWLILIMFARMTTKENLGQYALALAFVVPVFSILNLQLRPLYILDTNGVCNYKYSNFYYLRCIFLFLSLFFCVLIGVYNNIDFYVLILVIFLKFFEGFSDIIYAYYNAKDKTQLISKSLIFKGVISIILVFFLLYFFDFYYALLGFVLVYFFIWYFLDNKFIIKTGEIKNKEVKLSILKFGIPMGVSLGIVSLQSSLPRIFLEKSSGVEDVGVFTVLTYFIIVGSIFMNSICQYLSPKLTRYWNSNIKDFKITFYMLLKISIIFGLICIFIFKILGQFLIRIIYGDEFVVYYEDLNYIMVAGLFLYLSTVAGYTMTAIGFVRNQIFIFAMVLLLSLIFCNFIIPRSGIQGAAIVLILSYLVQALISTTVIFYLMRKKS